MFTIRFYNQRKLEIFLSIFIERVLESFIVVYSFTKRIEMFKLSTGIPFGFTYVGFAVKGIRD
jgi:hypothetical protein